MELYKNAKESRVIIISAVNKLVDFLKPAYGPANNKLLLEINGRVEAVDDGKTAAEHFELEDIFENKIVKFVRETADRTNRKVGDGTTTSFLLLQSFLNLAKEGFDQRKLVKEIQEGLEEVRKYLLDTSKPVNTLADLKKIALTSFNNKKIADLIAKAIYEAGKEGIVVTENSATSEMSYELVDGIRINKGLVSPYLVTNENEAVMSNPLIFVTDKILSSISDITPIMKQIAEAKKELLFISAGLEKEAFATIVLNKLKGLKLAAINVSNIQQLKDIALSVGANLISENMGRTLASVKLSDLGTATKVTIDSDRTTIIGTGGDKKELAKEIAVVKKELEKSKDEQQTAYLKTRLAMLESRITIIKVGAPTENELSALNYKVEDSVNATQAAFRGGVSVGAGLSYINAKPKGSLFKEALKAPNKQIIENIGEGDYSDIQDPTEVLIAALESSVSIACLLLESKGLKVAKPKETNEQ